MAYYYAEGKLTPGGGALRGTVVQIVKGELRKIGDWEAFTHEPEEKLLLGWYWYNTHKETRYWMKDETVLALAGNKAELFEQLHKIYKNDNAFFHAVADKLEHVSVFMFEWEIERREDVANHTPHDVKYVIYNADDYGRTEGEPIGTAIVTTTGDDRADQVTGIKRYLAAKTGEPEDKVMGIGFYNAVPYGAYAAQRDEHLTKMRINLEKALDAAVWEHI